MTKDNVTSKRNAMMHKKSLALLKGLEDSYK